MFEAQRFTRRLLRRIGPQLAEHTPAQPKLRVGYSDSLSVTFDLAIERGRDGLDLTYSTALLTAGEGRKHAVVDRTATALHWFLNARDDPQRIVVNLGDGYYLSDGRYAYSSPIDGIVLLPDAYFFNRHGFDAVRAQVPTQSVPWQDREARFVWRGRPTGNGFHSFLEAFATHPATVQRIRLAWASRDLGFDFGFVEQPGSPWYSAVNAAGFLRDRVEPETWFTKKYALDIDGFANTWDHFFLRLMMGCCVLKVAGDFGYRQWYYDRLVPFETHVPVRADLSDLAEKMDWVRSHDTEARAIAQAGQALALSLDFETVSREAGRIIDTTWKALV